MNKLTIESISKIILSSFARKWSLPRNFVVRNWCSSWSEPSNIPDFVRVPSGVRYIYVYINPVLSNGRKVEIGNIPRFVSNGRNNHSNRVAIKELAPASENGLFLRQVKNEGWNGYLGLPGWDRGKRYSINGRDPKCPSPDYKSLRDRLMLPRRPPGWHYTNSTKPRTE